MAPAAEFSGHRDSDPVHLGRSRNRESAVIRGAGGADRTTELGQAAHALLALAVVQGERVAIHLPPGPDVEFLMRACVWVGASPVPIPVSRAASAVRTQLIVTGVRLVITADGYDDHGAFIPLKDTVDRALAIGECRVRHVVVLRRTGGPVRWGDRDVWWHALVNRQPLEYRGQSRLRTQ